MAAIFKTTFLNAFSWTNVGLFTDACMRHLASMSELVKAEGRLNMV